MKDPKSGIVVWRPSGPMWAMTAVAAALLVFVFYDGLKWMVSEWVLREEYSHGFFIPVITVFLIWQRKHRLEQIPFSGSWAGLAVVAVGVAVYLLGEFSTLLILVEYAFVVTLVGTAYALVGRKAFRLIAVPLLLLVFMIPLPDFLYQELSAQLQLLSSQLGVAFIRLFGISVHLEGNVIDLGTYKLQVVEACNGLRYLFPLATLAFIAAYFFNASFWKRCVIFVSSIPITIFMNSFRIGAIGVLVEYWGIAQAEGFLHDFEGWVIFMSCTLILMGEMWVLSRFGKDKRPLREIFGMDFPDPTPKGATRQYWTPPRPFVSAVVVLVATAVFTTFLEQRVETSPDRRAFLDFPMTLDSWQGKRGKLEEIYIDALKFDDYILADFTNGRDRLVNLYVAYYASQRKGESAHSPRSCIPGGGWRITELTRIPIEEAARGGSPLHVNRVVIRKGEYTQLVYYWFQQRGRNLTNEYLVKWYLFWDALTRNRTDGALVRLTTLVPPGKMEEAEKDLRHFVKAVSPPLDDYIPE